MVLVLFIIYLFIIYLFIYYLFIVIYLFIIIYFYFFNFKGKDAAPKLIFQEQKLSSDRLKRKLKGKELDWYQRDLQLEVKRVYRDAWHLPP